MKSNRICSESLKKLIIKRFESGKSSDELFFHVMIFFGCVAVSHAILALYVYNEAFYKIMSLAFVFFSYIIMPIIFYHIPFAWNFFPKYKIFVNIEDIQYYDELSKIFDFNCAYTKQVILNKNINFIKNKIANNGYLDGGSINNLIDEIILLKKKTDEDKKIEEEKNIAEQKKTEVINLNMNTNAFFRIRKNRPKMKKIICRDTLKEFSEQYLKRNKDDNDELICFWGLLFLLLTFCMIPIGILDTNNQFIEHYKESIVGLWIIIFTFSMMLPNKILVKFLPKTTYINLIFKNNYNGDISDILDIKDEITKKIISENKERIKFYVHSNGYLSGKTLAYLLKEINRENLRIKKEERFSNKSLNFVEKNNIKKERIEKIDKE